MLNNLLETLSAFVFPVDCEICGVAVHPHPPLGVCGGCQAEVKLIAPPHCQGCGRTLTGKMPRCAECRTESYAFDQAYACAAYQGAMRQLIHAFKFENRKYLKHFFVKTMTEFMNSHLTAATVDGILPVPIDKDRRLERGFNQSELISMEISRVFGIPHSSGNLIHLRPGAVQSQLAKNQRQLNVKGAFLVRNADEFHSKRLLLIDDILTTGYTASECAKMLKKAGATSVTVLALARGVY